MMPKPKKFKVDPAPNGDEAIDAVISVMDEWFWAIEDGKANKRFPDPEGVAVSKEDADNIIAYIDWEIKREVTSSTHYFGVEHGMDVPADFNRLKGQARIAFAQALLVAKSKMGLERGMLGAFAFPTSYSIFG